MAWEYCELAHLGDGVLLTFSGRGAQSGEFSCGGRSSPPTLGDPEENPLRIGADPAQGPLMAALDFLGGTQWELVAVLDRESPVM
jgi:hypothetical protein